MREKKRKGMDLVGWGSKEYLEGIWKRKLHSEYTV